MAEAAPLWVWDFLAKAANLAQFSGLHAVMLVARVANLLRIRQCRRECAELEQCACNLRAQVLLRPTGCDTAMQLMQRSEMGVLVRNALRDADGLVESYNGSTLWCHVRMSRRMVSRFRDVQNQVNSCCGLVLLINWHILTMHLSILLCQILLRFGR